MNEMQHPEFGSVRFSDMDGVRWYVGKDVSGAIMPQLGVYQTSGVVSTHVTAKKLPVKKMYADNVPMVFIEKSGVNALANYAVRRGYDEADVRQREQWILEGDDENAAQEGDACSEIATASGDDFGGAWQIFDNPEFGKIRVIEIDGDPWWVLADVCKVLEIANPWNVAARLDDDEKGLCPVETLGGNQQMTIVNEPGLYKVLLRSDKPKAEPLMHWITHDVIPDIRKHGAYMTPATMEKMIASPEFGIKLLTALKEEQDKRAAAEEALARSNEQCIALEKQCVGLACENEIQRQRIAEFEPVRTYMDEILSSTDCLVVSQIAADYGMSAIQLNRVLESEGVQHKINGQWILRRDYMGLGFTESKTATYPKSDGTVGSKVYTVWTQKGRLLIHGILTKLGYQANIDRAPDYVEQIGLADADRKRDGGNDKS